MTQVNSKSLFAILIIIYLCGCMQIRYRNQELIQIIGNDLKGKDHIHQMSEIGEKTETQIGIDIDPEVGVGVAVDRTIEEIELGILAEIEIAVIIGMASHEMVMRVIDNTLSHEVEAEIVIKREKNQRKKTAERMKFEGEESAVTDLFRILGLDLLVVTTALQIVVLKIVKKCRCTSQS